MHPNRANPIPPFIRWAGSKRKLVSRIQEQIPDDCERYIEPFAGSACVFFAAIKGEAILADFNPDLICAFEVVKKHPRLLARKLAELAPTKRTYYRVRDTLDPGNSDIDRATRFLFLNAHCFNGVYRTNRQGKFNVPMGTKTAGVPSERHLARCSIALRQTKVVCQDYTDTLRQCSPDDFVYLDPPYPKPDSRNRGEYGMGAFCPDNEPPLDQCVETNRPNGHQVSAVLQSNK